MNIITAPGVLLRLGSWGLDADRFAENLVTRQRWVLSAASSVLVVLAMGGRSWEELVRVGARILQTDHVTAQAAIERLLAAGLVEEGDSASDAPRP